MNKYRIFPLLLVYSVAWGLVVSSCSGSATKNGLIRQLATPFPQSQNTNSAGPSVGEPTPSGVNGAVTTDDSDRWSKPKCEWNPEKTRQTCVFTLDEYESGQYIYEFGGEKSAAEKEYAEKRKTATINGIVSFIESSDPIEGDTIEGDRSERCELVAISSWGYADSQILAKGRLRWADIPKDCIRPQREFEYLANKDLAWVRGCLIRTAAEKKIKGAHIVPKDWETDAGEFKGPKEKGGIYRKVLVIVERKGRCM
jgi:hypothetical protein